LLLSKTNTSQNCNQQIARPVEPLPKLQEGQMGLTRHQNSANATGETVQRTTDIATVRHSRIHRMPYGSWLCQRHSPAHPRSNECLSSTPGRLRRCWHHQPSDTPAKHLAQRLRTLLLEPFQTAGPLVRPARRPAAGQQLTTLSRWTSLDRLDEL